jgi:predicted O-linked N-acetylglucosamine transferase (SPINDLY family)
MNRQQRRAAARAKPVVSATPPSNAASVFAAAVHHHGAGRLIEAEAHYRRVLAAQPGHADAAFNLGVALRQLGKIEEAIAAYTQTLAIRPDYPEAHYNLGNALMAAGKTAEAIAAYGQALRLEPKHARARANLGAAYSHLGVALLEQHNYDAAGVAFAEAVALKPAAADTHFNLGNVRRHQGEPEDAVACYARALAIDPDLAEAHSNLGNVLIELGRFDDAIAAHSKAVSLRPNSAEMHFNFGNALNDRGKAAAAAAAYNQALRLDPNHIGANANLGIVLMNQGRIDEAIDAYAKAINLKPDDSDTFSNLLFCRNYDARMTPAQLFAAHRTWDERHGVGLPRYTAYANDRTSERRIRIGYVSPDFRTHSVANFLMPLFKAHDRTVVEVFCYSDVIRPDAVTAQFSALADHWLSVLGMADDTLAERIRADKIDILVDLAGHTAHNRLRVFARKPAPIQVTYLGYSNTTGLRTIDYRFVDDITDPPGAADSWASETLLRLPGGFLCYDGPKDAPQPAPPPCLRTGAVTFGSFNNPAKVSRETFDVWAQLLMGQPNARLLLKGKPFADEATRAMFLAGLNERGISSERIKLMAWLPGASEHLALYEQIDVALDPFPYNGTTTTCEALWMGVPVVTLKGDRHSARVGASLLTQIGMTDWVASSIDDYIGIALALASDPANLRQLRRGLRQNLAASGLCDGNAFASKIEDAFRSILRRWCEEMHL